jgi:TrmH family RNA methyltransferase
MLSKSEIRLIQQLSLKKFRQKYGLFLVEGDKLVRELLASSWKIHKIYAVADWIADTQAIWPDECPLPQALSEKELERASAQKNPNRCLAIVEIPKSPHNKASHEGWTLALDRIRDPGNLGTIIRTADWFGIENLVCSPDCVDLFNSKVVQASMGSLFRVLVSYQDLAEFFDQDKRMIYAASLQGENLEQSLNADKGILLLGNESQGIAPELMEGVHYSIRIPGSGSAESLNASIAAAILMYQVSPFRKTGM